MQRLVAALNPEEHRVVARATAERMLHTPSGNDASPTRWATKWLETPRANRDALFGRYADVDQMDAVARTLRAQAEGGARAGVNASNTAYELERVKLMDKVKVLMGSLGGPIGGSVALSSFWPAALGIGVPYGVAEGLTHPSVLRSLVRTAGRPVTVGPVKRAAGQAGTQG